MLQVRQKVPSHADLFWPVVLSFRNLGGSADKEQLLQMVAATMGLGDDVTAIPHKNGPSSELGYRVGWVQTWLKQGGMLDNPQRGVWVLTSLGRNASKEDVEYLHANRRRDLSKRKKIDENNLDYTDAVQEEQKADREVSWQGELIDTLKAMPALAFERLTKLLLLQLGFSHVHVVGQSGDGGIDVLGIVKVNSVLSFKIIVQCKRFKGTVGPSDVRDFRGAMQGRTDKALFITTGRFTEAAKGEATRDGVPAIDLVDGEALALLLKDIQLGVKTEMVEKVSVVKEFFSNV